MLRISDKTGPKKVYKLRVIGIRCESLQTSLIEQFFGWTGDLHVETDPISTMEEVLSSEQLVEEAAE